MRGFIAGLLAWLCVAGSALAEKRLALVIGNDLWDAASGRLLRTFEGIPTLLEGRVLAGRRPHRVGEL